VPCPRNAIIFSSIINVYDAASLARTHPACASAFAFGLVRLRASAFAWRAFGPFRLRVARLCMWYFSFHFRYRIIMKIIIRCSVHVDRTHSALLIGYSMAYVSLCTVVIQLMNLGSLHHAWHHDHPVLRSLQLIFGLRGGGGGGGEAGCGEGLGDASL
jgi:hypothetical protein